MKRSKTAPPVINIGISSLIVTFIVLCLVVFAVLSLASADNDYKNSRKLADHREAYYEACNTSEDILNAIEEGGYSAVSEASLSEELKARGIDAKVSIKGNVASWKIPTEDKQSLVAEVELGGNSYTIKRWQTITER